MDKTDIVDEEIGMDGYITEEEEQLLFFSPRLSEKFRFYQIIAKGGFGTVYRGKLNVVLSTPWFFIKHFKQLEFLNTVLVHVLDLSKEFITTQAIGMRT